MSLIKQKIESIIKSVFIVNTFGGHGSGFFITAGKEVGWALTNFHVVDGNEYFDATMCGDQEENTYSGKCVKSIENVDIAIIAIDLPDVIPLRINFEMPKVGDDVYAIGTPGHKEYEGTVTRGVVSGIRGQGDDKLIQSDVTVHPGSSGGPLLDEFGNVIGVAVSGDIAHEGINFFIPIKDALKDIKHT